MSDLQGQMDVQLTSWPFIIEMGESVHLSNELICKTETLTYLEKEHRATKGKGLVLEDRLGVWN